MNMIIRNLRYILAIISLMVAVSLVLFSAYHPAQAQQANGEVCVRAFQDANGNGIRDLNDVPLQGGISANLLNEQGVIVASALLANSPTVTRGLICFQSLPAGQYTLEVTSADFKPTTPTSLTTVIQGGDTPEVPYVMEFGGQDLSLAPASDASQVMVEDDPASVLTRIMISALGALAALIVMTLLGLVIYLVAFRGRLRRVEAAAVDYRRPAGSAGTRTTGTTPVVTVNPTDTSEFRPKN